MPETAPHTKEDLRSFEAAYEELAALVTQLESGALTLDQGLEAYERGVAALKRCYRILDQAERRLELLVQDADGRPQAQEADLAAIRQEPKTPAALARAAVLAEPAPPAPTPSPAAARADVVEGADGAPGPDGAAPDKAPARRRAASKKKPRPPSDERNLF